VHLRVQAAIDQTQAVVNGKVRLKFYKGNVIVVGRQSDNSLFSEKIATFEDVTFVELQAHFSIHHRLCLVNSSL
jgi:argininosuccinate synthase